MHQELQEERHRAGEACRKEACQVVLCACSVMGQSSLPAECGRGRGCRCHGGCTQWAVASAVAQLYRPSHPGGAWRVCRCCRCLVASRPWSPAGNSSGAQEHASPAANGRSVRHVALDVVVLAVQVGDAHGRQHQALAVLQLAHRHVRLFQELLNLWRHGPASPVRDAQGS